MMSLKLELLSFASALQNARALDTVEFDVWSLFKDGFSGAGVV